MMLRRSMILWAGALVFACGGKSEIMPPPNTGGTAGTGAVGGGGMGGGGMGGAGMGGMPPGGYGGGGYGGMPPGGYGGGGMGGGGYGGMPPGGGGFGGGPGGLVQQICQKLNQVCPIPDCYGEMKQGQDLAAQYGCSKEYEAILYCALQTPISCGPDGDPELSPMCDKQLSAFESCIGTQPSCAMSAGPGTCSIECGYWGAKCAETTGGLYCTCTDGPKAGQSITFGNMGCWGKWDDFVESFCN